MRVKANLVKGLLCVLFLTWPVQAKYGGGSGEPNDPYLIYTAEQMNTIGTNREDWDKHFRLMADIDLSGYTGTDFSIIGTTYLNVFSGVFDGNGHTISNFTYVSTSRDCTGLFGYVSGENAQIKDLGLIDPDIDAGTGNWVGSIVGRLKEGNVTCCYAKGGSISGNWEVGGLVGSSDGIITNCYATGSVLGNWQVGDLVGSSGGTITSCYAAGSVSGGDEVGGLVGRSGGTITNCRSSGSVSGNDEVGGLVGSSDGTVAECYTAGSVLGGDEVGGLVGCNDGKIMASCSSAGVTGRNEVGGLVGHNSYRAETVDCYASGDVVGQRYVGGLMGNNPVQYTRGGGQFYYGTVRNCYSVTYVSGDQQVGGLVGYDQGGGVRDCFWDMETSGQSTCDGGEGKTTTEMQTMSTFTDADWDFVDIWSICEGTNYPRLTWQIPAGDFVCPDGFTIEDFLFFIEHWQDENCDLSNDYCQGTDLDFSGTVDADDLEILLENWLTEGELEN